MKQPSRKTRYGRLVRQRRADTYLSKYNFTNPADTPFDSKHIGSFAQWAGDLNADIVIVHTDWRSLPQYLEQRGAPACCTACPDGHLQWARSSNGFLLRLLQSKGCYVVHRRDDHRRT